MPAERTSEEARAFAVVVETMRGEFKVFGEALGDLTRQVRAGFDEVKRGFEDVHRRFEQVDLRFAQVDARFDQVDARFDQVDARFDQVDARFDQVDARFDRVERDLADVKHDVGLVKIAVLEHSRELKEVRASLDRKVDRDEVEGIVERVLSRSHGR
jgi:methyl-accepting chemotaxis protein